MKIKTNTELGYSNPEANCATKPISKLSALRAREQREIDSTAKKAAENMVNEGGK